MDQEREKLRSENKKIKSDLELKRQECQKYVMVFLNFCFNIFKRGSKEINRLVKELEFFRNQRDFKR